MREVFEKIMMGGEDFLKILYFVVVKKERI